MNHQIFQTRAFITHWLNAVDAHSIHSPFFYEFYTRVVRPGKHTKRAADEVHPSRQYDAIENARLTLLKNHSLISVLDLGAGSKHTTGPQRKISDIARRSLSAARFSQLYHRAIANGHAEHILELGTSLGINALYLAAHPGTRVTTLEGSPEVASVARSLFHEHRMNNIDIVCGNIDDQLPLTINQLPRVDFAFIDANHRHAPTLRYFNLIVTKVHAPSMVVLDDIHSNSDMERAWNEVKEHPRVTGSVDLFRCGFVFFDPSLNSQHFVLQI